MVNRSKNIITLWWRFQQMLQIKPTKKRLMSWLTFNERKEGDQLYLMVRKKQHLFYIKISDIKLHKNKMTGENNNSSGLVSVPAAPPLWGRWSDVWLLESAFTRESLLQATHTQRHARTTKRRTVSNYPRSTIPVISKEALSSVFVFFLQRDTEASSHIYVYIHIYTKKTQLDF